MNDDKFVNNIMRCFFLCYINYISLNMCLVFLTFGRMTRNSKTNLQQSMQYGVEICLCFDHEYIEKRRFFSLKLDLRNNEYIFGICTIMKTQKEQTRYIINLFIIHLFGYVH
jgi:hypothetical protein